MHPFFLIYISEDGEILSNHLNVKNTLDIIRIISKWKSEPIKELYESFNEETDDGKKMDKYSFNYRILYALHLSIIVALLIYMLTSRIHSFGITTPSYLILGAIMGYFNNNVEDLK